MTSVVILFPSSPLMATTTMTTMMTSSQGFALSLSSLTGLSEGPRFPALIPLSRNRSFRVPSLKAVGRRRRSSFTISAALHPPLDLTEENIRQVLIDARSEFGQLFDASVGITGEVDLAELDGPFVKIRLKGRFWHKRSTVLDRISNYLKNRIPEILEVDIEDEKQLDDSPVNF